MIEFLSEEIRNLFHSLPPERQIEMQELAAKYLASGQTIQIVSIEKFSDGTSEMDIRILKKFDVSP